MEPVVVGYVGLLLASHTLALWRPWRALRRGRMPRCVDFATLGLVVFYDIGLVLETVAGPAPTSAFDPLLDAADSPVAIGILSLAAAPWLLRGGARLSGPSRAVVADRAGCPPPGVSRLPWSFYLLAVPAGLGLAWYGWTVATRAGAIWVARAELGPAWGPLIVVLYLPLHILAFYVGRGSARSRTGGLVALGLAACAVLAALPIGQRALLLLPVLILILFRRPTVSPVRLIGALLALVLGAAALLPVVKWQYASAHRSLGDRVLETLHGDLSRAGVLRTAIERAELIGTSVLPYPMAGYVYGALFFVPRGWAPFKGDSTAKHLTADLVGRPLERTEWGVGVGVLEEVIINAGLLAIVPGLLLWGLAMGWLDTRLRTAPPLSIPVRLGALWLVGYGLAPVLLVFGMMTAVGWLCSRLWPASPRHQFTLRHFSRQAVPS